MKSTISVLSLPAIVAVVLMSPSLATAQNSDPDPTYAKDVAPIFQRSCQVCHRPNNMAPMSLMTYQESRPWARSIKERVMTRVMPPWHMDHKVGVQEFKPVSPTPGWDESRPCPRTLAVASVDSLRRAARPPARP